MKKFLLFVLVGITHGIMLAGVITGKVIDEKGEPLEFVNVAVYKQGETVPHKGSITDETGRYEVDGVADGTYTVQYTFMGFQDESRTVSVNANNKHHARVNTVRLKEDRAVLQEVSVSTQKAAMKLDIDKKVFDVSQNITTAGLSASEALENIPSVEVDQEGNISLRGSQSVTVWINGKAQGLTSDNRGDILQQLPAESIERIEVITNPSSKYSPEGSAGIINIILKRDRKAGYYGGVQLNVGKTKGDDPHGRLAANINYSSGILEAYANVGLGRRVRSSKGFTDRDFLDTKNDDFNYGFLNSRFKGGGKGTNLFGRAGFTWHFTEKDEIGLSYMGMKGLGKHDHPTDYTYQQGFTSDDPTLWTAYPSFRPYNSRRRSFSGDSPLMNSVSLNYRHEWKTNHTLDAVVSYSKWHADHETGYDQYTDYLDQSGNVTESAESHQWQESCTGNSHVDAQLDYVQPLSETSKFEAGYKGTWFHEDSPTETWNDRQKSENVYSLYNRFVYDQHIQALYVNYQNRIGRNFGYQVGLRGEYWQVETESYNYDQEHGTSHLGAIETVPKYTKDFFQLFPTVFLSYQLPANQELQVNYTRRLSRPWGGQLNSFKNINDSTSISYGNPSLTPTYTNSFELNYLKNWDDHTLSVSAYYRPSSDVIQRISYLQDGIRYQTNENISKEVSSGLEVIGKNKLFRVIDLTTTVNAYYYKLDGGTFNILDQGQMHSVSITSDEDFSWNASMMAQVTLPWQLAFQATGRYNAARVIAQGKRDANYALDMGLRRSFFDKKLTVNLNGRNVLDSRKMRAHTHAAGYRQLSENVWGSRRFGIQISYSFGNMRPKMRERGEGGEGEDQDHGGYSEGGGEE
ncbi:MAG: TonB-dependent receptor [Bacteroidales bacterium]|nr:TonB-dependent receptor [Bacteroidales bacterium]